MSPDTKAPGRAPEPPIIHGDDEFRITLLIAPDGVIEDVLEASRISGIDRERILGRTIMEINRTDVHDPDRADEWEQRLRELASVTAPVRWKSRQPGAEDGAVESVAYTATPIRDPTTGDLQSFLLQVRDGSRQHRTEAQLRASAEHLRAALAVTGLGSFTYDPIAGRMTADERLSEIIGRDAGELIREQGAEGFYAIVHPGDREAVRDALVRALRGEQDYDVEYRLQPSAGSDGAERWIRSVGRVEFEDGSAARMLGVVEDITELRARTEAQLRSQKREAIGTLAGGIAHDFNNVISAILSNASVARTELAAGASPATSIAEIALGAERAADLVRRLLAFSREEPEERISFDLAAVVRDACALSRATLPAHVELESSFSSQLPPVHGSPTELHQVIVNLVDNAGGFADQEAGRVGVEVRAEEGHDGGPGTVELRITDNGPGIAKGIRHRVFDPFFTTRGVGEGTGLGLSAAQTIVRGHGGEITIGDAPGGGALVTVVLPASAEPVTTPAGGSAPLDVTSNPAAGRLRVLFVDDEPALVMLAERALPHRGFQVRAFTGPEAALDAYAADPGSFDAVVTDLSMPGMDGLELIGRVREHRPGLPVVLSSGFITPQTKERAEALLVDAIVPKPCSLDDLADALLRVCTPVPD